MTTLTYSDAYLAKHVTDAREVQAMGFVADLGTLPEAWVTRLSIIRAYIVTCQECMTNKEDAFSAKLKAYESEFKTALASARAAQALIDAGDGNNTGGGSMFTVGLERG